MTWAKIAAAKITQTGPKGKQGIKWHCPVDVTNQPMIEKFCLTMCQKHNFRDISIRAGVHNTFSKKDANGIPHIEYDAPWHFTVEFEQSDGKFRNAHVYTQVRENKTEGVGPEAIGFTRVGGRIKENPEIFGEQRFASHKRQITAHSVVSYSMSARIFHM